MKTFKPSKSADVCDEIRYDFPGETLLNVEFFKDGEIVFPKLTEKLKNISFDTLLKNEAKILSSAPFLSEFIEYLKLEQKNIYIKSAIKKFNS